MSSKRRWPKGLMMCAKCSVPRGTAGYSARGLCSPCYRQVILAGDIDTYVKLTSNMSKEAFGERTKGFYKKKKELGSLYYCVRNIGAEAVAEAIKIDKQHILIWMRHGAPDQYQAVLDDMQNCLKEQTRLAGRGERR